MKNPVKIYNVNVDLPETNDPGQIEIPSFEVETEAPEKENILTQRLFVLVTGFAMVVLAAMLVFWFMF